MVVSEYEYAQKRNSKFKEFGTTLVIVLALVFELVALFGVNGTDVIAYQLEGISDRFQDHVLLAVNNQTKWDILDAQIDWPAPNLYTLNYLSVCTETTGCNARGPTYKFSIGQAVKGINEAQYNSEPMKGITENHTQIHFPGIQFTILKYPIAPDGQSFAMTTTPNGANYTLEDYNEAHSLVNDAVGKAANILNQWSDNVTADLTASGVTLVLGFAITIITTSLSLTILINPRSLPILQKPLVGFVFLTAIVLTLSAAFVTHLAKQEITSSQPAVVNFGLDKDVIVISSGKFIGLTWGYMVLAWAATIYPTWRLMSAHPSREILQLHKLEISHPSDPQINHYAGGPSATREGYHVGEIVPPTPAQVERSSVYSVHSYLSYREGEQLPRYERHPSEATSQGGHTRYSGVSSLSSNAGTWVDRRVSR